MPHLGKMVLVSVEIFFRRMCLVYVKNNMAWRGMAIAQLSGAASWAGRMIS